MRRNRWFENGKQMVKSKTHLWSEFHFSILTAWEAVGTWGKPECGSTQSRVLMLPWWVFKAYGDKQHAPIFFIDGLQFPLNHHQLMQNPLGERGEQVSASLTISSNKADSEAGGLRTMLGNQLSLGAPFLLLIWWYEATCFCGGVSCLLFVLRGRGRGSGRSKVWEVRQLCDGGWPTTPCLWPFLSHMKQDKGDQKSGAWSG